MNAEEKWQEAERLTREYCNAIRDLGSSFLASAAYGDTEKEMVSARAVHISSFADFQQLIYIQLQMLMDMTEISEGDVADFLDSMASVIRESGNEAESDEDEEASVEVVLVPDDDEDEDTVQVVLVPDEDDEDAIQAVLVPVTSTDGEDEENAEPAELTPDLLALQFSNNIQDMGPQYSGALAITGAPESQDPSLVSIALNLSSPDVLRQLLSGLIGTAASANHWDREDLVHFLADVRYMTAKWLGEHLDGAGSDEVEA